MPAPDFTPASQHSFHRSVTQKPHFLYHTKESIWTMCRSCDTSTKAAAAAAAGYAGCSTSQGREGCSENIRKINKLKVLSPGRAWVSSGAAHPFDLSPESSWDQVRVPRPPSDRPRWSTRTLSTVLILDQFSTQQAGHVLRGYRGKRGTDVVTQRAWHVFGTRVSDLNENLFIERLLHVFSLKSI